LNAVRFKLNSIFTDYIMKKHAFLVFLVCIGFSFVAQAQETQRTRIYQDLPDALQRSRNIHLADSTIRVKRQGVAAKGEFQAIEIPFENRAPFTAFSFFFHTQSDYYDDLEFRMSTSRDGKRWSKPVVLEPDPEFESESGNRHKCAMTMLDPGIRFVRISFQYNRISKTRLKKLEYNLFVPGEAGGAIFQENTPDAGMACSCALPDYLSREDWCTSGECNPTSTPVNTLVTHLIVHHSAGGNTSSNWNAVVTSIYNDHVFNNGWSDIGYNWLIAPTGVLYQGRDFDKQGAHFCGYNAGTMGVCMMGTYTNVQPTLNALNTLEQLLAWKCCLNELDPSEIAYHNSSNSNLFRISGHRDGCNTMCPGDQLYALLPTIRDAVQGRLIACQSTQAPQSIAAPLVLAPNPFTTHIVIQSEQPILSLQLWNMQGSIQAKNQNQSTLEGLGTLPSELYLLQVETASGRTIQPVVKQ
jgi:hypothetical protein